MVKDPKTGIVFDDWSLNEVDNETSHWAYLCNEHADSAKVMQGGFLSDSASDNPICSVKGCNNHCDFYYDFNGEMC